MRTGARATGGSLMTKDRSRGPLGRPGARRRSPAAPGIRRTRAGFTMLELTVAIAVLMVATLAAFGSQVHSFALIGSSRDAAVAMTDLEVCMEEVLTRTADEIPASFPAGEAIAGFDDLHLTDQRIVPTYPGLVAGAAPPDPLQIDLVATWNDRRGRPQQMRLTTIRTR